MDFNNFLLKSMMPYGHYDTRTVHRSAPRICLNYFCAFVSFFCGVKTLVIVLMPWDTETEIVLFLVELYIVNSELQKYFYLCLINIHFGTFFIYVYWGYLSFTPGRLQCLNMFFMSDIGELCKCYDLRLTATKRFVKTAGVYRRCMQVLMFGFEFVFALFIVRCLVMAYFRIDLRLFLAVSCPMALLTYFSYHCLTVGALSMFLLFLITMDFLILRLTTVSDRIRRRFNRNGILKKSATKWVEYSNRKSKPENARLLRATNEIIVQFRETNTIFDYMLAIIYINCLFGGLLFPAFLFIPFPVYFKIFSMFMYTLAIGFFCFFLTAFNDRFIRKVGSSSSII